MPGRDTGYEAMAREAALRIDRDRELAEQLTMLPDEDAGEGRGTGRGKGKALSQMREWLATKGFQLPEEQIARMAGLSDARDPIAGAMADAERIVAWAFDGKTERVKQDGAWVSIVAEPKAADYMAAFERCYASRQRAAEALLPYGLAKVTPDVTVQPTVQVVVPAAPSQPAMRDITPVASGRRMVPADVAHQIERNQQVSEAEIPAPDAKGRTE